LKKVISTFLGLVVFSISVFAQTDPFNLYLEPMNISGLEGLQSFAWAQHNGKWLIIGGRVDGLHRRQPFAAFDANGKNDQLIVVDPIAQKKWSAPLSSLPESIQEQLSSSNMEFQQVEDYLYVVGGYGFSKRSANHITYPNLSAVHVPDVINAVIKGTAFNTKIRQITDSLFAVTGGSLDKINNTFYLTGGQKFIGRYNPMGPNHGPGFSQTYTNSIRKFTISDNGKTLSVTHLPAIVDPENLHRRDYNVVPQIMPTGEEGLTAFSGVFQLGVDLPYLNSVNIVSTGYSVDNSFSQYYNHYHSAHIPLYSVANKEMHTIFLGGIAQYFDSSGILVQDSNVPFVKTIARVTRNGKGVMAEYKLPIEMPSLLGSDSEFIPIEGLPRFKNEVLKLDEFTADSTLIGYIYGGIESTKPNIFFINSGTQSSASNQVFKVYIIKNSKAQLHKLNKQSTSSLKMQIYPRSTNGDVTIKFNLEKQSQVKISFHDSRGTLIDQATLKNLQMGQNSYSMKFKNQVNGAVDITIETSTEKVKQRIIF
jgi:hypothetical protein